MKWSHLENWYEHIFLEQEICFSLVKLDKYFEAWWHIYASIHYITIDMGDGLLPD